MLITFDYIMWLYNTLYGHPEHMASLSDIKRSPASGEKKTSSSKWWTASWRVMRSPGTVNRTRNKSERPNQSKSQIPHDMWEHMQIPFLVLPPDAQAPTMEGIKFRVVSGTRNFAGSDNRCLVSSGLNCKTWVHRALSKQTGNHLAESHSLNLGF
jgi:hypothetical protein